MSLIQEIIAFVLSEWTALITFLVLGFLTFQLSKFYLTVFALPKGPFPLPILGNILNLRGYKCNNVITFAKWSKKYGPVWTFWFGSTPMVLVHDLELGREAFKKLEFAGRPKIDSKTIMNGKNNERGDILFDDFGGRWETLRRVAHSAVRKYAITEKLAELVCDVVDEAVNLVLKNERQLPFEPKKYIQIIFYNIIASSSFGRKYSIDDPEIIRIRQILDTFEDKRLLLMDFVPFLRLFYKNFWLQAQEEFQEYLDLVKNKYSDHLKDFDFNKIRDFCDALILTKKEAIAEAKETAQFLTDDNLALAIFDLFLAGSDTSQYTTRWIVYYLANFTEYQQKLREEIDLIIGTRMPVQEDRNNCHLVNAFIHEVIRSRPVASTGVPHKSLIDTKIGDYFIPKNTIVSINIYAIHNDPKYFPEPHLFKPERFLDSSGRFVTQKPSAFIPFGTGRRICLGERLAFADIFLVVVNLLQKTKGYEISLPNGPGSGDLEMDPMNDAGDSPKEFKVFLKKLGNC